MLLSKDNTIGENKHHSRGFTELSVHHHRSRMVPPQQPDKYSTEPPMMKEMSTGKASSSTTTTVEERGLKFLYSLRVFPWFKDFQNLLKGFKFKEIDADSMVEKMAELFQGDPELIAGFNQFLPESYHITIPRVVCPKRKRKEDSSNDGVDDARAKGSKIPKVSEERFCNDDRVVCQKRKRREDSASDSNEGVDVARAEGSKIRKVIRSENKTRERFCNEGDDEDESTESKLQKVIAFVNKVEERFRGNDDVVDLFLDMVCKRSKSSSPNRSTDVAEEELQIYEKVATLLGDHHDLIDEFTQFLAEVPRMDSIIDFNTCKRGTPSYRLLPMNFPIPAATGREELASEVLNDRWISVDNRPDSTTSRGRKSQHELELLEWEEEMCENEVWEKNVESAISTVETLIRMMHNMSPTKICIEKCSSHMSLIRCINYFYGKGMIDAVNNNIQARLPRLLERLRQKGTALRQKRSDIQQKWAYLFC